MTMKGNCLFKGEIMVWTLFVLDFDATYDNEDPDSPGVQPTVYLIPLARQREVEHCAGMATQAFWQDTVSDLCIGDHFEAQLNDREIPYKIVGTIDLTFGERQVDYLADYIPREIV